MKAAEIVSCYMDEFFRWLQALSVEPVIRQMRLDIDSVVDEELERAIRKGFVPEEYRDNMRHMMRQSFDKYLHVPMRNLRRISKESEGSGIIDSLKEIFAVNTDHVDPGKYKNRKELRK